MVTPVVEQVTGSSAPSAGSRPRRLPGQAYAGELRIAASAVCARRHNGSSSSVRHYIDRPSPRKG